MTQTPSPTKDETYWKILNSAVSLDIQVGHLAWTMTQLSKKSGVSRTLIYYYFGKSKSDLLKQAISTIGDEMAGTSQARLDLWKTGKTGQSFLVSREILRKNPALLHFYIFNRTSQNELGKMIQAIEMKFLKKLSQFFPGQDQVTYESLFALFFGIGWLENLSGASVHRALDIIHLGIGAGPNEN